MSLLATLNMTAGHGGSGIVGFDLFNSVGSLSPSSFVGKDGLTHTVFDASDTGVAPDDFQFQLNGAPSQTGVFDFITFTDKNGVLHNLSAAAADSFSGGSGSPATWVWHQPNGPMFTIGNAYAISLSTGSGPPMSAKTFAIDPSSIARLVKKWFVIDVAGVARNLKKAFVIDAGGIARLIFDSIVVASITPTLAQALGFGPATLTTNTVAASATGGSGTYVSFAWSWQSGGAGITITSPSTAVTAFSGHIISGASLIGVAQCAITDSSGTVGIATVDVNITATN
jgi:hypothetical protein